MADTVGTAFRMIVPLLKSMPDADHGGYHHVGIASDETVDLQGDRVVSELVEKSYGYLTTHGKHNWDHHPDDIGDVLGVRRITAKEAMDEFGFVIKGVGTAVHGNVYPLVEVRAGEPDLNSADLKTVHHRMRANARLGYSLDGVAVRVGGVVKSMLIPQIAICPQPINAATFCQVVRKSLGPALEEVGVPEGILPDILSQLDRNPDLVIDGMGPGGSFPAQVAVSRGLFDILVRKAFGARNAPPGGQLAAALRRMAS